MHQKEGLLTEETPLHLLSGETRKNADELAALPDRLDRYAKAHKRALMMSGFLKSKVSTGRRTAQDKNLLKLVAELKACGSLLLFHNYFTVKKVRLHSMHSCRVPILCPLCSIRRGAKLVKAYMDKLAVIREENPRLKAYLVSFTVKNGEDLGERFRHVQRSLQTYHQQRNFAKQGKRSPVEANKALGAVWSYEFKRGDGSGLWHPHVHAVWLCEEAPDQERLREEWKAITGDSHMVDVTPFHDQTDVIGGFLEVFKYSVKFADLPLEDNFEGYLTLRGKRLVGSFGAFRGVKVPESMTDDALDDLPYMEMLFKYIAGSAKYALQSSIPPKYAPFPTSCRPRTSEAKILSQKQPERSWT